MEDGRKYVTHDNLFEIPENLEYMMDGYSARIDSMHPLFPFFENGTIKPVNVGLPYKSGDYCDIEYLEDNIVYSAAKDTLVLTKTNFFSFQKASNVDWIMWGFLTEEELKNYCHYNDSSATRGLLIHGINLGLWKDNQFRFPSSVGRPVRNEIMSMINCDTIYSVYHDLENQSIRFYVDHMELKETFGKKFDGVTHELRHPVIMVVGDSMEGSGVAVLNILGVNQTNSTLKLGLMRQIHSSRNECDLKFRFH